MAENFTIRRTTERERIIQLIREHMTDTISKPSDADCFDFALKAAEQKIGQQPKPRSPRKH